MILREEQQSTAIVFLERLLTSLATTLALQEAVCSTRLVKYDWDGHEVIKVFERSIQGIRDAAWVTLQTYFDSKIPPGNWTLQRKNEQGDLLEEIGLFSIPSQTPQNSEELETSLVEPPLDESTKEVLKRMTEG